MNRKNINAAIVITGVLAMAWGAWFIFFKPHKSIDGASLLPVQADSLFLQYQRDEVAANLVYLDKALEVSGKVTAVTRNQIGQQVIILDSGDPMGGIACTLAKPVNGLMNGQAVKIRGFCSGFLSDVVLRDAKIINP
jgi:hypothetical protein